MGNAQAGSSSRQHDGSSSQPAHIAGGYNSQNVRVNTMSSVSSMSSASAVPGSAACVSGSPTPLTQPDRSHAESSTQLTAPAAEPSSSRSVCTSAAQPDANEARNPAHPGTTTSAGQLRSQLGILWPESSPVPATQIRRAIALFLASSPDRSLGLMRAQLPNVAWHLRHSHADLWLNPAHSWPKLKALLLGADSRNVFRCEVDDSGREIVVLVVSALWAASTAASRPGQPSDQPPAPRSPLPTAVRLPVAAPPRPPDVPPPSSYASPSGGSARREPSLTHPAPPPARRAVPPSEARPSCSQQPAAGPAPSGFAPQGQQRPAGQAAVLASAHQPPRGGPAASAPAAAAPVVSAVSSSGASSSSSAAGAAALADMELAATKRLARIALARNGQDDNKRLQVLRGAACWLATSPQPNLGPCRAFLASLGSYVNKFYAQHESGAKRPSLGPLLRHQAARGIFLISIPPDRKADVVSLDLGALVRAAAAIGDSTPGEEVRTKVRVAARTVAAAAARLARAAATSAAAGAAGEGRTGAAAEEAGAAAADRAAPSSRMSVDREQGHPSPSPAPRPAGGPASDSSAARGPAEATSAAAASAAPTSPVPAPSAEGQSRGSAPPAAPQSEARPSSSQQLAAGTAPPGQPRPAGQPAAAAAAASRPAAASPVAADASSSGAPPSGSAPRAASHSDEEVDAILVLVRFIMAWNSTGDLRSGGLLRAVGSWLAASPQPAWGPCSALMSSVGAYLSKYHAVLYEHDASAKRPSLGPLLRHEAARGIFRIAVPLGRKADVVSLDLGALIGAAAEILKKPEINRRSAAIRPRVTAAIRTVGAAAARAAATPAAGVSGEGRTGAAAEAARPAASAAAPASPTTTPPSKPATAAAAAAAAAPGTLGEAAATTEGSNVEQEGLGRATQRRADAVSMAKASGSAPAAHSGSAPASAVPAPAEATPGGAAGEAVAAAGAVAWPGADAASRLWRRAAVLLAAMTAEGPTGEPHAMLMAQMGEQLIRCEPRAVVEWRTASSTMKLRSLFECSDSGAKSGGKATCRPYLHIAQGRYDAVVKLDLQALLRVASSVSRQGVKRMRSDGHSAAGACASGSCGGGDQNTTPSSAIEEPATRRARVKVTGAAVEAEVEVEAADRASVGAGRPASKAPKMDSGRGGGVTEDASCSGAAATIASRTGAALESSNNKESSNLGNSSSSSSSVGRPATPATLVPPKAATSSACGGAAVGPNADQVGSKEELRAHVPQGNCPKSTPAPLPSGPAPRTSAGSATSTTTAAAAAAAAAADAGETSTAPEPDTPMTSGAVAAEAPAKGPVAEGSSAPAASDTPSVAALGVSSGQVAEAPWAGDRRSGPQDGHPASASEGASTSAGSGGGAGGRSAGAPPPPQPMATELSAAMAAALKYAWRQPNTATKLRFLAARLLLEVAEGPLGPWSMLWAKMSSYLHKEVPKAVERLLAESPPGKLTSKTALRATLHEAGSGVSHGGDCAFLRVVPHEHDLVILLDLPALLRWALMMRIRVRWGNVAAAAATATAEATAAGAASRARTRPPPAAADLHLAVKGCTALLLAALPPPHQLTGAELGSRVYKVLDIDPLGSGLRKMCSEDSDMFEVKQGKSQYMIQLVDLELVALMKASRWADVRATASASQSAVGRADGAAAASDESQPGGPSTGGPHRTPTVPGPSRPPAAQQTLPQAPQPPEPTSSSPPEPAPSAAADAPAAVAGPSAQSADVEQVGEVGHEEQPPRVLPPAPPPPGDFLEASCSREPLPGAPSTAAEASPAGEPLLAIPIPIPVASAESTPAAAAAAESDGVLGSEQSSIVLRSAPAAAIPVVQEGPMSKVVAADLGWLLGFEHPHGREAGCVRGSGLYDWAIAAQPSAAVQIVADPYGPEAAAMLDHCQVCTQIGLSVQSCGGQPALVALYAPSTATAAAAAPASVSESNDAGPHSSAWPAAVYLVDFTGCAELYGSDPYGKQLAGVLLSSLRGLLENPEVTKVVHGCEQVHCLEVACGGALTSPLVDTRVMLQGIAFMLGLPPSPPPWVSALDPQLQSDSRPLPAQPSSSTAAAGPAHTSLDGPVGRNEVYDELRSDLATAYGYLGKLYGVLRGIGLWSERPRLLEALARRHYDCLRRERLAARGREGLAAALWLARPLGAATVAAAAGCVDALPELWVALAEEAMVWVAAHAPLAEMKRLRNAEAAKETMAASM